MPLYKQVVELNVTASEVLETTFAKVKDELCDSGAVKTDASRHAVGAVLLQSVVEEEYPRLCYGQALNAAQRNYFTNESELLGDVKACDAFRVDLLGREFTLNPDLTALSPSCNSPGSSKSRIAKWLLALQPFRFTLNHIKGEVKVAAAKLSRSPWTVATPKAVEIIQLAGDFEPDSDAEEESNSDREQDAEEVFQEDNPAK